MPGPIRVLYVDDEAPLLQMGRQFLELSGDLRIGTAISAQEALELLRQERYDAIVSDYLMPEMDGIVFLKQVRREFGDIPFILFTGRGRESVVIEALNNGADFYLQKGGMPETLYAELEHKIKKSVHQQQTEKQLTLINAELQQTLEEERLISDFAQFLTKALTVDEILDYYGKILHERSGADYLMLAKLDPVDKSVGIHALLGMSPFLSQITRLVSASPLSLKVPVAVIEAERNRVPLEPGLKKLEGGIAAISRGYLSKPVCIALEKLLGLTSIYIYELVWQGRLYGSITFGFSKGKDIQNKPLITTMSNLLANGLWRIYSAQAMEAERVALAESEAKFRTIFENSPYPVAINTRPEFRFMHVNAAFLTASGFLEEEVIGKNPVELGLIAPEVAASLAQQNLTHNKIENIPLALTAKGGRPIHILFTTVPFTINGRDATLTVTLEVTALKKAEEELLRTNAELVKNEYKFRSLFETMAQGVVYQDTSGAILSVNPAAEQILGRSSGQMVGGTTADPTWHAIHEDGSAIRDDEYPSKVALRTGRPAGPSVMGVFHPEKKAHVWLSVMSVPMFHPQETIPFQVYSIFEDISEQKRSKEALFQANRKLNLLSGITRHDIKNQLMALMGFLELSKNSVSDPARTEEFIEREKRIAAMISNQINFTRDYEDLGVNAPAWQNVAEISERVRARLPATDAQVEIETGTLEIYADPLFEKVIFNLLDNALRYAGPNLSLIRISARTSEETAIITIEDDGEGIVKKDRGRLFERGYGRNTGLGLFLSREILSITGISITENGSEGKGARFEITVPKGGFRYSNS